MIPMPDNKDPKILVINSITTVTPLAMPDTLWYHASTLPEGPYPVPASTTPRPADPARQERGPTPRSPA